MGCDSRIGVGLARPCYRRPIAPCPGRYPACMRNDASPTARRRHRAGRHALSMTRAATEARRGAHHHAALGRRGHPMTPPKPTARRPGGHNDALSATALAPMAGHDAVLVATKVAHPLVRRRVGLYVLARPPAGRCRASLKALGVDRIGLYQYHRRTRPCRTRIDRCAGGAAARGQGRAGRHPTRAWTRSARPRRSSSSPACRTSCPRRSADPRARWPTAPSRASRSCPGARSAESAKAAGLGTPTLPSTRSARAGVSPSRSAWPWLWPRPRSSSPSRRQPPPEHRRQRHPPRSAAQRRRARPPRRLLSRVSRSRCSISAPVRSTRAGSAMRLGARPGAVVGAAGRGDRGAVTVRPVHSVRSEPCSSRAMSVREYSTLAARSRRRCGPAGPSRSSRRRLSVSIRRLMPSTGPPSSVKRIGPAAAATMMADAPLPRHVVEHLDDRHPPAPGGHIGVAPGTAKCLLPRDRDDHLSWALLQSWP